MTRKKQHRSNLRFAAIFFACVVALILMSLAIRIIVLVKNSTYNKEHRFNVAIFQNNETSLVSFSPDSRSITILNLSGKLDRSSLSELLELPIDATIDTEGMTVDKGNIATDMSNVLFHFNDKKTSLTIIDAFNLFLFSKDVPQNSIYERDLALSDAFTIDTFSSSFFIDSAIANEKTTIQVVNATSVFGLGGRLASLVANMGGDVVLVSSADTESDNSKILYSDDSNYTVDRLSSVLGFLAVKAPKTSIADIVIIVGKESLKSLKF